MGIWNHINKIFFHNQKCNFVQIIEQVRNIYHYTVLFGKNANLNNLDGITGNKVQDKNMKNKFN